MKLIYLFLLLFFSSVTNAENWVSINDVSSEPEIDIDSLQVKVDEQENRIIDAWYRIRSGHFLYPTSTLYRLYHFQTDCSQDLLRILEVKEIDEKNNILLQIPQSFDEVYKLRKPFTYFKPSENEHNFKSIIHYQCTNFYNIS